MLHSRRPVLQDERGGGCCDALVAPPAGGRTGGGAAHLQLLLLLFALQGGLGLPWQPTEEETVDSPFWDHTLSSQQNRKY